MDVPMPDNTAYTLQIVCEVYLLSTVAVGHSHSKRKTTAHITYTPRNRQLCVKQLTSRASSDARGGLQALPRRLPAVTSWFKETRRQESPITSVRTTVDGQNHSNVILGGRLHPVVQKKEGLFSVQK